MSPKWCDRALITMPLYYTLATSQNILDREVKRLKCPTPIQGISDGADAMVHFFENNEGKTSAIVCIFNHSHGLDETFALLVHEATHIWQRIRELMGEKEPSHEFEAYSLQQISLSLFKEYKRQTKGKRRRK
jgi:hypothetical protein